MLDAIIIFGAKYLFVLIIVISAISFFQLPRERQKKLFVFAFVTFPLMYITSRVFSKLYFDPRPFVQGNFVPLISHVADNGFPSDHTLISSAFAAVFYYFNKRVGILLFAVAFLVGAARVFAGVHHFIDIFASMFIAIFVAYFIQKGYKTSKRFNIVKSY